VPPPTPPRTGTRPGPHPAGSARTARSVLRSSAVRPGALRGRPVSPCTR